MKGFKPDVVGKEGWFYSKKVKDHFFNPRNIFKNKKEAQKYKADGAGTIGSSVCGDVMKLWIKVDKKKDRIKECKFQTFGCLPANELVSTPARLEKIGLLKSGNNIINSKGEKTFIEETHIENFNGKMLFLEPLISKANSFEVTPNHPVLAIKRKWLKNRKQKHTAYVQIKKEELAKFNPEFIPASEIEKGDYLVYTWRKQNSACRELKKNDLKLLGIFLAEGYFSAFSKKEKKFGVVAFAFNKNEKQLIHEISDLLKQKYGKKPKQRIRGNACELYLCSRKAVDFFEKYCSHSAASKRLDEKIMGLPLKKQAVLLEYYSKGDGHIHKDKRGNRRNTHTITTASKILAFQTQELIARQGFFATIRKVKSSPSEINGREIKQSELYVINFIRDKKWKSIAKKTKDHFLIPVKDVKTKPFSGKVYNLQVYGEDKTFLVKGFAVHNCASAIASTSILTVMVTEKGGMKIEKALKLTPKDIMNRLGGLPERKIHCSVLGDKALREAINDYFRKTKQFERITEEGTKIIDKALKITNKDIEEAVLEGAKTFEDVQKRTKIGVKDKNCVPEVKKLIKYYRKKHFGKK